MLRPEEAPKLSRACRPSICPRLRLHLPLPAACSVLTDEPGKEEGAEAEDDVFLKKIETQMLSQVALQVRWAGCLCVSMCTMVVHA